MVGNPVLANTYTSEGSVGTSGSTLTLPWNSRQVVVINDSSSINLSVTLGSGDTMTLHPTETLSINIIVGRVTLAAASSTVAYRLWVYG